MDIRKLSLNLLLATIILSVGILFCASTISAQTLNPDNTSFYSCSTTNTSCPSGSTCDTSLGFCVDSNGDLYVTKSVNTSEINSGTNTDTNVNTNTSTNKNNAGNNSGSKPGSKSVQLTNPLGDQIKTFPALLTRIVGEVGKLISYLGTIMLIVAGILYLTSAGNPERMGKAKTALVYAIAGIVIGLAASTIVNIIKDVIGVK